MAVLIGAALLLMVGMAAVSSSATAPSSATANAGWQEIGVGSASGGGISQNDAYSDYPSVAIDTNGLPVVAWADWSGGDYEIYVRRWNGAAWVELAGSAAGSGVSDNDGYSDYPSLVIDADGAPVVAWSDNSGGDYEIYVRRWNGTAWVELGAGSAAGGGISNNDGDSQVPELAVGPDGSLFAAWDDSSDGDNEIYARRWDGLVWVELGGSATGGGISNNSSLSYWPSLAVAPNGTPIVAWIDGDSDSEIYARRWNGTAWVELGGSAAGGGISNNSGHSAIPSLAVAPDGTPFVAWNDNSSGNLEIYVRSWNGAAWVELDGSATGGGISNNSGDSQYPSLVITADGRPAVAWDQIDLDPEIFFHVHTIDAWAEYGTGSASGGGISDNGNISEHPSLALAPDGRFVAAWHDYSGGNAEIYVRRSLPSADSCHYLALYPQGDGGPPTADPTNSAGCPPGFYKVGRTILLTAHPAGGERVGGWVGTDNDASTANTNTVTMPAADHRAGPIYETDEINCYSLNLSHTGQGGDPTAEPSHSSVCGAGEFDSEHFISLTAAPAAGWRVATWSGTNDDNSTATTNSLTMPAYHHEVSVTYELIPDVTHFLFAPAVLYQPVTCFPWPNEQEPNNTQTEANGPLCNGQTYTGLPDDNYDVFYFDMPAAGPLAVELGNFTAAGGQLGLLSAAFAPIAYDVTPADGFHINRANEVAGRYYIVVHTAAPDAGSAAPYSLRATFAALE